MHCMDVIANANLTRCANLALTSVPPMNGLISLWLAPFAVSDQKWIGANTLTSKTMKSERIANSPCNDENATEPQWRSLDYRARRGILISLALPNRHHLLIRSITALASRITGSHSSSGGRIPSVTTAACSSRRRRVTSPSARTIPVW